MQDWQFFSYSRDCPAFICDIKNVSTLKIVLAVHQFYDNFII